MSRELEFARKIIERFWSCEADQSGNVEAYVEMCRVTRAKPEELINDFETVNAILEKALKELRGKE